MKTPLLFLFCALNAAHADEHVTIAIKSAPSTVSESSPITLEKGDVARVLYSTQSAVVKIRAILSGNTFDTGAWVGAGLSPVTIAGPATLTVRVGDTTFAQATEGMVTFAITRTGTASEPVPIPQEAGTTWQVILEASSDLVNWSAVSPGDYPSSTPQRYFRTRLVKK